ncbi:MAG: peptide chain release factor-like protein [Desulfobacterota bacterium]|nr:peptide chain release factor-like protein [Thermodesulfobacteriota bacterium]
MKKSPFPEQGAYPFLLMDEEHFAGQCRFDAYTASGHGGQKRNRTYSAIRATHLPTGISVIAEESRSQHENKKRALRRLRKAIALRTRKETPLQELDARIISFVCSDTAPRMNPKNPLYPIMCATLLDMLYHAHGKISDAAHRLGISSGRMNKLLAADKDLFTAANNVRTLFNLKPLIFR